MAANTRRLMDLEVSKIFIAPGFNVRPDTEVEEGLDALMESIASTGIQTPLIVKPTDDESRYQVVAGHRRFTAVTRLNEQGKGIKRIPVIVRSNLTSEDEIEIMLGDVNSKTLSPLALAEAVNRATKICGLTGEEVAKKFGISGGYASFLKTLSTVSTDVKALVSSGDISAHEVVSLVREHGHQEGQDIAREAVKDAKAEGKKATKKHTSKVAATKGKSKPKGDYKAMLQSFADIADRLIAAYKDGKPLNDEVESVAWLLRECASVGIKPFNGRSGIKADTPDNALSFSFEKAAD